MDKPKFGIGDRVTVQEPDSQAWSGITDRYSNERGHHLYRVNPGAQTHRIPLWVNENWMTLEIARQDRTDR